MLALRIQEALESRIRVTCTKCGQRGHPVDHCLFVCRGCGELHDMGKCPMEEFYIQIRQWFNPTKHMGMLPEAAEKIYCIYAFVHKTSVDQVSKQRDLPDNTRDLHGNHTFAISSLRKADEYAKSDVTMTKDPVLWFKPQQSISYLENPADTGNAMLLWFRQANIVGKIHNEKAILLLDTGAEVFIVDKVGCYIDSSQIQDCVGIGDNVYRTEGRTRIKVSLAMSLVYFFDIWVGYLSGQEAILGMDFMIRA
ncbi:LOW QUALITY PROTEIN: Eukaryotic/viral aspartic protease [Phytophthora megakarya]|uniref:Eukaryotic/viral aspartic protease n=1 Tax=Phytophthora megakarya TaxID=4795 RepID=A0A225V328_9STRA|nr:LOW QUALITY PROTEIN: Eukaryotic/viral aspartic protease [Phytophthora megakarya]